MPWEAAALKNAPYPQVACPVCGVFPLEPFLRGQVQRAKRNLVVRWLGWLPIPWLAPRPYCAIICDKCHNVVGWEAPPNG